jgi:hypothetical protein
MILKCGKRRLIDIDGEKYIAYKREYDDGELDIEVYPYLDETKDAPDHVFDQVWIIFEQNKWL